MSIYILSYVCYTILVRLSKGNARKEAELMHMKEWQALTAQEKAAYLSGYKAGFINALKQPQAKEKANA